MAFYFDVHTFDGGEISIVNGKIVGLNCVIVFHGWVPLPAFLEAIAKQDGCRIEGQEKHEQDDDRSGGNRMKF